MKPFAGMVGLAAGFVISLSMFAVGVVFAARFLDAEPAGMPFYSADVSDLWSATPRRVDRDAQQLERLPPLQVAQPLQAAEPVDADPAPALGIDPVTTASLAADESAMAADLSAMHQAWCADRYRSYRPHDDSYTSYSGDVRRCVSPFSNAADGTSLADAGQEVFYEDSDEDNLEGIGPLGEAEPLGAPIRRAASDGEASLHYALDGGEGWEADHIASCFARYRSYRPEDNSYQPYGGGPRRQCH